VKWSEREDDHYNPSNAGINNEWKCTVGAVLRQTTEGMIISHLFHVWYISVLVHPSRIILNKSVFSEKCKPSKLFMCIFVQSTLCLTHFHSDFTAIR